MTFFSVSTCLGVEEHRVANMTLLQERCDDLRHALDREDARQREEVLDLRLAAQVVFRLALVEQKGEFQRCGRAAIGNTALR